MKTKWIIICAMLLISFTASAKKKEAFFKMGVKTGYDMSPVSFVPADIWSQYQNGYQAGIFLRFGKTIYVQPEAYYLDNAGTPSLRVPVMLGLRFLNLKVISFHLNGGPVCTTSISNLSQGFDLNQITYKWQLGAGLDLFGFITADIRYTFKDGVSILDQVQQFNPNTDVLNLTLGFKF